MQNTSNFDSRSFAYAAAAFVISYAVVFMVFSRLSSQAGLILLAVPMLASGAILGFRVEKSPLLHGLALGAISGPLAIVAAAAMQGATLSDTFSILAVGLPAILTMAIPGCFLCALGSMIGVLLKKRRGR